MTERPPIPGFTLRGNLYRSPVSVEQATAEDVAAEAASRGVPVTTVLRERVEGTRKRKPRKGGAS